MDRYRRKLLHATAALVAMPAQMRGPFYPLAFPLDPDNDLASVSGRSGIAYGTITNVAGRVLDEKGRAQAGELAGEFNIVLAGDGRLRHGGALPEAYRQARLGL